MISSLQAILFGQPNAALLGDEARFDLMCRHISRVADIAEVLGANVLVFGAPRSRQLEGLARNEAHRLGRERFRLLGEMLAGRPVTIGIEPVPAFYGGEFLTSAHEVIEMVKEVGLPTVQVHLDTGCVKLNGDSISGAIRAAAEYLCHFHVSEPDLDDFSAPRADHASAAQALKLRNYAKWIAIEMREPREASLELLERSVGWVLHTYFGASALE